MAISLMILNDTGQTAWVPDLRELKEQGKITRKHTKKNTQGQDIQRGAFCIKKQLEK